MAKKTVDLSKLREEIDSRKKETTQEGAGRAPKDSFLNELLTSLKTGQESSSTQRVKMVEQKAAEKKGEKRTSSSDGGTMVEALEKHGGAGASTPVAPTPTGDQDRDHLLYEEYERKMKEMFGEGAKELMQPHQKQQPSQPKQQINEEYLIGAVKKILNESFAPMVEEAMKDAIVEIYAVEKIKEVVEESEPFIREVVIKTIRDLQKKKKPQ
jgi:hypothetical protein